MCCRRESLASARACSGKLSRRGSVPLMASHRPAPRTTTPQRCSVAYLTATACWGNPGIAMPVAAVYD